MSQDYFCIINDLGIECYQIEIGVICQFNESPQIAQPVHARLLVHACAFLFGFRNILYLMHIFCSSCQCCSEWENPYAFVFVILALYVQSLHLIASNTVVSVE